MARTRLELQEYLENFLGSRNVYYQPPETIKMKYPAIVYNKERIDNDYADNTVYLQKRFYAITIIDKNPDSLLFDAFSKLPGVSFDRRYSADNLNHETFTMFW